MSIVTQRKAVNATEGPIFSKMILFALPLMLTNLIQQLYSMADNIVVGQFSGDPNALAAVGSTGAITALLTHLFTGFSAGTSVVVSRSFGAGDRETLSKGVHTSLLFAVISGIVFSAVGILVSHPLLELLDTKEILIDKATVYLRIICAGLPGVAVYNFGAAILRSVGDSKTPFYTLTASGILNVVLNLVFVIIFKLSIAGVAIATIVSQYLSAIVVVAILYKRRDEPYALNLRNLRIHKKTLLRVLHLGVPAAVQGSLFSITNLFLHSVLNSFPTPVISARTIATNIDVLLSTAINTYLHVTMTFTGQNLGAEKYGRIKKSLLFAVIQVVTLGVVLGQLMLLFYEPLVNLYLAADDPNRADVLAAAKTIMTVMLSSYFLGALVESLSGFLRGLGYSIPPMLVTLGGVCLFRIFWIFVIFPHIGTLTGLYLLYPISWSLTVLGLALTSVIVWKNKIVKPLRKVKEAIDTNERI